MNPGIAKRAVLSAFEAEERAVDGIVGVDIVEHAFEGYYNLRCDPADEAIVTAVSESIGIGLVTEPNRMRQAEGLSVYWLGPDEWLLRTPSEDDPGRIEALRDALGDHWHALTDLSSGLTRLTVSGEATRDAIVQGTTLDLDPGVFGAGQCAQTIMARTPVLLAGDGRAIDVIVRRSFSDHLLDFLRDAAHDAGYRFARETA